MPENAQKVDTSSATVYRPPHEPRAERLPLLALRGAGAATQALQAMAQHERLDVIIVDDITPSWRSFARHVARAVVVATNSNPFAALSYARRMGIACNLVIAASPKYHGDFDALIAGGVAAVVVLPILKAAADHLVNAILTSARFAKDANVSDLVLDPVGLRALRGGRSVRLSQREFAVLHRLSVSAGRPVSTEQILDYVWGSDDAPIDRSGPLVRVYLAHLRKKLATLNLQGAIATVRDYGFVLHEPQSTPRL